MSKEIPPAANRGRKEAQVHDTTETDVVITREAYERAIPPWCGAKTIEEHAEMLFCWGLIEHVGRGEAVKEASCKSCPVYNQTEKKTPAGGRGERLSE